VKRFGQNASNGNKGIHERGCASSYGVATTRDPTTSSKVESRVKA